MHIKCIYYICYAGSSSESESSADSRQTPRVKQVSPSKPRGRPRKNPKPLQPPPAQVSDSDAGNVATRKQTRSASARRSKHLIGRPGSDSDSETGNVVHIRVLESYWFFHKCHF